MNKDAFKSISKSACDHFSSKGVVLLEKNIFAINSDSLEIT